MKLVRYGKPGKEKQQNIETLMKNAQKIDDFLASHEPRMGQGKRPKEVQSNITDNESAKMTTSKGTIQGVTCVTASDEKHQVIIHAQVFGQGQEQSTLQPMVDGIRKNLDDEIFESSVVLTADTGFSSEANMEYIFQENIDAVIPDNQFRKRNPVFAESDLYNKHKERRKKTREDQGEKGDAVQGEPVEVKDEEGEGEGRWDGHSDDD